LPPQEHSLLQRAARHPHPSGRVQGFEHAECHQRPHHEGMFRIVALEANELGPGGAERGPEDTVDGENRTVRSGRHPDG
jgi:hypothetical protein